MEIKNVFLIYLKKKQPSRSWYVRVRKIMRTIQVKNKNNDNNKEKSRTA